jgi:hypothetical protein
MMKAFGLEFNLDKSRPLKVDGLWVVERFKFLGVTFHVSNTEPIIVEGTPRSGNSLVFDKLTMIEEYKERDKNLAKISKVLVPSSPPSPAAMLDSWGKGEFPGKLIPSEIIAGTHRVTRSLLNRLRKIALKVKDSTLEAAELSGSETNLFRKIQSGSSLNWLGIRKAGMILNRLHGGSWDSLQEFPDRSLSSPKSTKGRSLMELIKNEDKLLDEPSEALIQTDRERGERFVRAFSPSMKAKAASIWNSTSIATKLSLNLISDPKSVKVKGHRVYLRK